MWWIIVGIVVVVAATGYFVFGRIAADYGASREVVDRQDSVLPDGHAVAPAEPGSEDRAVVGDGVIGPGPSAQPPDS